jgi:hypothetical protein
MDSFDYDSLLDVDTNGLRGGAARVRALVSTFTPQAIEIGRILKQSKAVLPHGRFGDWCDEALQIDRRLAQAYMNLAEVAGKYGPDRVGSLPLTVAHRFARPSTPETVRNAVLERACSGRPVTTAVMMELIRQKRPSPGGICSTDPADEADNLSALLVKNLSEADLGRLARFLASAPQEDTRRLGRSLNMCVGRDEHVSA